MRVAVRMRVAGGNGLGRRNAAFEELATNVFELNSGVADLKLFAEQTVELDEDARAFRWRNVGDGDVACQRARMRAKAPDVQVVDVDDALDGFHAGTDLGRRAAARRAFEEDVQGFADDADTGPKNERGDEKRENGIDPVVTGEENAKAACDDGSGGKRVASHVQEGAAEVDVAGYAPQKRGDDAVHDDACGGHNHHDAGLNGDGGAETVHRFHGDPERDDDERGSVDEGSEDAGALVAEGAGLVGRARLEVDRNKTEQEGQEIGDVVAGFGEQRQRVSAQAGDEGDNDVGQRGGQRDAQDEGCAVWTFVSRRRMPMHRDSVTGVGYGGKARRAGNEGASEGVKM